MQTLKIRAEFQRVQKGKKWVTPAFIMHGRQRENNVESEVARFGFTVSSKAVAKEGPVTKKRGKAVDRNRARRRLKEAVRLTFLESSRSDYDYVIIGRAPALVRNFGELLVDMRVAFHNVGRATLPHKNKLPIVTAALDISVCVSKRA